MGYELHITRAQDWTDSKRTPIAVDSWMAAVDADQTLFVNEADYWLRRTPDGGEEAVHPVEWSGHPGGEDVAFWHADGEVTRKNPDAPMVRKMVELARALDARVLGDDHGVYDIDDHGQLTVDGEPDGGAGSVR